MKVTINYYNDFSIKNFVANGKEIEFDARDYLGSVQRLCYMIGQVLDEETLEALEDGNITELEVIEPYCISSGIELEVNYEEEE